MRPVWCRSRAGRPTLILASAVIFAVSALGSETECLVDPRAAVDSLGNPGRALDFRLGEASDPSRAQHWQGIQRLDQDEHSFLVLSRNGIPCANERGCGGFVVVPMGDRAEREVVLEFAIEEPEFDHAGGFQITGDLLAIGLEHRNLLSQVLLFDVSDPLEPRRIGATPRRPDQGAGAVGLLSLPSGYLSLAVGGWDSDRIDYYRSRTPGETGQGIEFELEDSWTKDELEMPEGIEAIAYQNTNLLSDCSGTTFLVATGRTEASASPPEDRIDLFRIDQHDQDRVLTWVTSQEVRCQEGELEVCNLRAAAGIHLETDGTLRLYAAEHENTGAATRGQGEVRVRSFAPQPQKVASGAS